MSNVIILFALHSFRFFFFFAELNSVFNEEVAYKQAEQEHRDNDFRRIAVKRRRNFAALQAESSLLEEDDYQRIQYHQKRIKVGQPANDNRRKAVAARRAVRNCVIEAGNVQKSDKAAHRAGNCHRADNDGLHVDARVSGRVQAFADDRNLVALLASDDIKVHCHQNDGNQNCRKHRGVPKNRQPARLIYAVYNSQTRRRQPSVLLDVQHHELNGNVVHHKREKGFVGVPEGLEYGRNHTPRRARDDCGHKHNQNKQKVRHVRKFFHYCRRGQCAHKDLPLPADVPELHFIRRKQRDSHSQKQKGFLHGFGEFNFVSESSLEDFPERQKRIFARNDKYEKRVHQNCNRHRDGSYDKSLFRRYVVTLRNSDERAFCAAIFSSFHFVPPSVLS